MADGAPNPEGIETAVDPAVAHTARIWNYWLGGKDNYEVDRVVGEQIRQLHPMIGDYARADRQFLGRAVRYLVNERGVRQFLDIGTGLPTVDNTHEVAQAAAPESRYKEHIPGIRQKMEKKLFNTFVIYNPSTIMKQTLKI